MTTDDTGIGDPAVPVTNRVGAQAAQPASIEAAAIAQSPWPGRRPS